MRLALLTTRVAQTNPFLNFYQHMALSLGPLYLEAYLHAYGPQVDVCLAETLDEVLAFKPDLVGLSVSSPFYSAAREQARKIKAALNIPVIIGGPHISSLPKTLGPEFDCGVVGEGEETFRQLVLALRDSHWNSTQFSTIDGLVFWRDGQVQATKPRTPISPIDRIPRPRRAAWAKNVGIAHLISARGCPYRCTFCTQSETMTKYRAFSPQVIADEIRELVENFGVRHIRFFDDVFNISLKQVKALGEVLRAEGLTKGVIYSAWARANTLDEPMIEALESMNVHSLAFGFESGSQRILSRLKTNTTIDDNLRAMDLCEAAGIVPAATFIIGYPGEALNDLEATYAFLQEHGHRLGDIEVNPLVPMPGTEIWEWACKQGYVSNDMTNWGVLREQAHLATFNPAEYIYMNEAMPYEMFQTYVKKFERLLADFQNRPLVQNLSRALFANLTPAQLAAGGVGSRR